MGISFEEFLGPVVEETDRQPAIVAVVFDFQNCANAVGGMADSSANQGIDRATPARLRPRAESPWAAEFRSVEIGIRLITARLARLGKRTGGGFHKFTRDFGQEARRS